MATMIVRRDFNMAQAFSRTHGISSLFRMHFSAARFAVASDLALKTRAKKGSTCQSSTSWTLRLAYIFDVHIELYRLTADLPCDRTGVFRSLHFRVAALFRLAALAAQFAVALFWGFFRAHILKRSLPYLLFYVRNRRL